MYVPSRRRVLRRSERARQQRSAPLHIQRERKVYYELSIEPFHFFIHPLLKLIFEFACFQLVHHVAGAARTLVNVTWRDYFEGASVDPSVGRLIGEHRTKCTSKKIRETPGFPGFVPGQLSS